MSNNDEKVRYYPIVGECDECGGTFPLDEITHEGDYQHFTCIHCLPADADVVSIEQQRKLGLLKC